MIMKLQRAPFKTSPTWFPVIPHLILKVFRQYFLSLRFTRERDENVDEVVGLTAQHTDALQVPLEMHLSLLLLLSAMA